MTTRPIARIVTAHQQREGAGFLVRRPVDPTALRLLLQKKNQKQKHRKRLQKQKHLLLHQLQLLLQK